MSKTLKTLLKISQKKLDDQTQALANLNKKRQDFIDEKNNLITLSKQGIDNAKDDALSYKSAHNYAQKVKLAIIYIDDQVVKIDELIKQEKQALNGLFLEKKRHEILLENFEKRRKAEINRKIQNQLDDFNSIAYTNNKN